MAEWKVPGMAFAVVKDGEAIHAAGYGVRDIETGQPVTADTIRNWFIEQGVHRRVSRRAGRRRQSLTMG